MNFQLSEIAAALDAPVAADARITGWSIDTRTIQPGDCFIALRGPAHDGNAYVEEAFEKGAAAAIHEASRELPPGAPAIAVTDTLQALNRLAIWARVRWGGEVVGVTGSAGKTSTKDVIARLLSTELPVAANQGNLNNHIGVPLSVLRLPEDARVAVLELGMNHAGEIRRLAEIARPRIGVVTNVGSAHIENFESVEGIAEAKRELIEALPSSGIAVLNADDPLVAAFREVHSGATITYGLKEPADVRAEDVTFSSQSSTFRVGDVTFTTQIAGRHGILNILAGIAVAGVYGITPASVRQAVSELEPGAMRGQRLVHDGIVIINDCYNSNPDAAKSMIDVLRDQPAQRTIAVLGEMLELGRWSEPLHRQVGNYAAEQGVSVLVGIRGAARFMVDAAIEAGLPVNAAYFFDEPAGAGLALRDLAGEGDAILFKGSRGTHVERALETFLEGRAHTGAPQ